jgi:hypothetical protein
VAIPDTHGFERLKQAVVAKGEPFATAGSSERDLREAETALGLPESVVALYGEHGPAAGTSIPWVAEDLLLFALDELAGAQTGYRTTVSPAGEVPSPSWPQAWLAVASVFGDPFVIDTSGEDHPILFTRHGAGVWAPLEVAASFGRFLELLAEFEDVLIGDFDLDPWGDKGLRPEFLETVKARLGSVVSAAHAEAFTSILA